MVLLQQLLQYFQLQLDITWEKAWEEENNNNADQANELFQIVKEKSEVAYKFSSQ